MRQGGIDLDGLAEYQAVALPVLGHVRDFVLDRVRLTPLHFDFFAVNLQLPGEIGAIALAENTHRQLGTPGAHQAVNADDLALAHVHGHIVHHLALRIQRMVHCPIADFHLDVADHHVFPFREAVGHLAADHALDNPFLADRLASMIVNGLDGSAVPDNGYFIRDVGDLVELMGNDNHGHSLFLKPKHQIQQRAGIFFIQGGCGFVQNQQFRVLGQRLGDFNQLLFAGADGLDLNLGAFRQTHHFQIFIRFGIGLVPVNGELVAAFIAQIHVFTDRHLRHQGQFLMNDDDAQFFGILDVGELADLSVVNDIPFVRSVGIDAAQNVHQRGFSGAVLTDQRVDFSFFHLKANVVERFHTREGLRDVSHFQKNIGHGFPPAFLPERSAFRRKFDQMERCLTFRN